LKKHRLNLDLSHEKCFDNLIHKIMVSSEEDPEYTKHLMMN
jgi:hypothetical protein